MSRYLLSLQKNLSIELTQIKALFFLLSDILVSRAVHLKYEGGGVQFIFINYFSTKTIWSLKTKHEIKCRIGAPPPEIRICIMTDHVRETGIFLWVSLRDPSGYGKAQ